MVKTKYFYTLTRHNEFVIADNQGRGWGRQRRIVMVSWNIDRTQALVASLVDGITINGFPLPRRTQIQLGKGDTIGLSDQATLTLN